MKNILNKRMFVLALAVIFAVSMFIGSAQVQAADSPDLLTNEDLGIQYAQSTGLGDRDVRVMVADIVRTLLGLLGILAVVIILIGGFKWMTAMGEDDKIGEAKKLLSAGVIGLVIILCAYAIANFAIDQLVTTTTVGPNINGSGQ